MEKQVLKFPIVGIGASAGGLEAFAQLLQELPADTGMAFVLIQHLDPNHSSFLTEVLVKATVMPVQEITDKMRLVANNVYVIPPNVELEIVDCVLHLLPRDKTVGKQHLPIDSFFRSLAVDCAERAIGVILSGTASDGTDGLRAIKEEGGFTFAQDPHTAKYPGMPESAVSAGVVDFSLSIPKLGAEIVRLGHHLYYSSRKIEPFSEAEDQPTFQNILHVLKTSTNVDFNEYKHATTKRRLARRMALLRIETLSRYLEHIRNDINEAKALCEDILIHVTSFFRDPESFDKLQKVIFPQIMKHKQPGSPVRMWIAGCSSGEEVYSVVIALLEFLGDASADLTTQIFGSDISDRMIEKSRAGFYPEALLRDMNPDRLRRFFVRVEGGYRVSKLVRDLCVFVRHDLASDPPFSRLDLITCRNVLIYFDQRLQKRILSTFHYCLNQPGFLLLGRTENVSSHQQLFFIEDKVNKIFSRTAVASQLKFSISKAPPTLIPKHIDPVAIEIKPTLDLAKTIDNLLLNEYAPCGVLVNERLDVLQFRGRTSLFIEQPPGQPEANLLKIAREGLFVPIKMLLAKAKKDLKTVRKDNVQVKQNGKVQLCNVIVMPVIKESTVNEQYFLVLFEEKKNVITSKGKKGLFKKLTKKEIIQEERRSTTLEKELEAIKEYLQSLNLEHQKTNDALATANEEFVSGNEELQSMNEELETAKEELQSTNEELHTVNDELQNRNQEVGQANNDLVNLLNSVEIPILILDLHRRIRRFTPHARTIMNLLPGDIGRSIDDIRPNITVQDLDKKIDEVISSNKVLETEVQDGDGRWHNIQIRPYKTLENKIDGVVLSLVDINKLRRAVSNAEWARDYATSIVEAMQIPLVVLDKKLM